MSTQTAHTAAPLTSFRPGRSAAAVAAALVATVALTTATDQLFHVLDVYPPWGQPMPDAGDNLLAFGYRWVYGILGGYLAARAADQSVPGAPMRAALAFGAVGLVVSALGAFVTITQFDLGPDWYPLLLVAVALPSGWLGGALARRRQERPRAAR
jgi:hypothetical protein